MRRLISCDFFDFDSAEQAMCEINRIDCNGIKMSLNRKDRYDIEGRDRRIIPIIPAEGTMVSPYSAVAVYADTDTQTAEQSDKCSLLISFDNHRYASRIINILRRHGAVGVREIKY